MIAVTGADIVFSWLPGLRCGLSRSFASGLRRNRMRAGCELAVVGPSFTMSQICRSCASVTSPDRALCVRALRKRVSRHSSLTIAGVLAGWLGGAAILAGLRYAGTRRCRSRFKEDLAMADAFICDAIRTPFGRYGGTLAALRADDLAALPLRALIERNQEVDWSAVDDITYGCANQAGEDNRNVGRMALLLAGMPKEVPGNTVNRLCGSSLDAVGIAARAIKAGEASLMIAGGVESMTRAPFVMGKADSAFSRVTKIEDTTIGWRFVNKLMKEKYGIDSMPETAENVATDFGVSRADQDALALRSQRRWAAAHERGFFKNEIVPVLVPQKKGDPKSFDTDEHPRADTTLEMLARLKGVVRP